MFGLLFCWELWLGPYSVDFFFSLPVMLLPEIPKFPTDPPVRGFPSTWELLLHESLPRRVSIPNTFVSLFFFYILSYLLFKKMGCLYGAWCPLPAFKSCFVDVAQHSDDLLMNLWGRKWAPNPIPLPSEDAPNTIDLCV